MNENDYIYLLLAFILGYFANSIIKQMCGKNVEGMSDKELVESEEYSCGNTPQDNCVDCGYRGSYYWKGGCNDIPSIKKRGMWDMNQFGPVIPLQEPEFLTACQGGKCGVWCNQTYENGTNKKCKRS